MNTIIATTRVTAGTYEYTAGYINVFYLKRTSTRVDRGLFIANSKILLDTARCGAVRRWKGKNSGIVALRFAQLHFISQRE